MFSSLLLSKAFFAQEITVSHYLYFYIRPMLYTKATFLSHWKWYLRAPYNCCITKQSLSIRTLVLCLFKNVKSIQRGLLFLLPGKSYTVAWSWEKYYVRFFTDLILQQRLFYYHVWYINEDTMYYYDSVEGIWNINSMHIVRLWHNRTANIFLLL